MIRSVQNCWENLYHASLCPKLKIYWHASLLSSLPSFVNSPSDPLSSSARKKYAVLGGEWSTITKGMSNLLKSLNKFVFPISKLIACDALRGSLMAFWIICFSMLSIDRPVTSEVMMAYVKVKGILHYGLDKLFKYFAREVRLTRLLNWNLLPSSGASSPCLLYSNPNIAA